MSGIGYSTSRSVSTSPRFAATAELIKKGTGSYVDGKYVVGADETTVVKLNYQAASEDDRQNIVAGERIREAIVVYIKSTTRDLVRPIRQGTDNTPGDIIKVWGISYEVYSVENFSNSRHIKATCLRVENQNG